jgi:hypothetical protein
MQSIESLWKAILWTLQSLSEYRARTAENVFVCSENIIKPYGNIDNPCRVYSLRLSVQQVLCLIVGWMLKYSVITMYTRLKGLWTRTGGVTLHYHLMNHRSPSQHGMTENIYWKLQTEYAGDSYFSTFFVQTGKVKLKLSLCLINKALLHEDLWLMEAQLHHSWPRH